MLDENATRLLIVDDLPENLQALNAIIRAEDRIVHQAQSGEAALDLLLEHEFALAILDVQMPGMNGFELAKMMRGTQKTRHIPIIFVTAAATELNYAFQGYETGAVDFLYKPLNIEAVKSKVNVFVALCKQRNEIQRQLAALKQAREEQDILLKELRSTQAELERSIHMRDEFMSMVAHELRTPLNALVLDAQVRKIQLKGGIDSIQPVAIQKMLEKNDRQLQNMIRLIDDMLDVTRMRNGKLSICPAPMELSGLLKRVIDDFASHAEVSGCTITLHTSGPATGKWDGFRIEQIIINLLTNALRYGAGNPIAVEMDATEKHVSVKVKDQGIGISDEDQKRIFDPFERAAENKVPAGLGLGLYISRQLAEAHGGSLAVQSELQQGSVFTLILPI
jgi:signal transduction histidine kinase